MQAADVGSSIMRTLRNILSPLTTLAKFDWKKIDAIKLKASVSFLGQGVIDSVRSAGDALKPAIDILGGIDDIAIDKLISTHAEMVTKTIEWAHKEIDAILASGGATGIENEIEAFLQNVEDSVLQRLAA